MGKLEVENLNIIGRLQPSGRLSLTISIAERTSFTDSSRFCPQLSCNDTTLKIISANVNGIRSAYKKGFYEYIAASGADIVCVQELKAQEADLSDEMKNPHGMHGHWHCAEKRGYSGVAVYSKRAPDNVQIGMGIEEFDREGRFVRCDFGKLSVISLYLPSGTSAPEQQELKYRFLDAFYPMLEAMKAEGRDIVVCGDWNIAHQNIDLKNWKGNQKNSSFLPKERK